MKAVNTIGVFKYDLFPYMIVHKLLGWTKEGDVKTDLGIFPSENFIAAFPSRQAREIKARILIAKNALSQSEKDILSNIVEEYPALHKIKKV